MRTRCLLAILTSSVAAATLALGGCAAPVEPATPTPTPVPEPTPPGPTHAVDLTAYYDQDGDGQLAGSEIARVPGVDVRLGGRIGRTARRTGEAHLDGVPEGAQLPDLVRLPPYFEPSALPTVYVPPAGRVFLGLTLEIGGNQPNVYMAFGDSITEGVGSSSGTGYREVLVSRLRSHFGVGKIVNEGVLGSRTARGRERLGALLAEDRPAYTLILYGTNDWNDATCKYDDGCATIDNLRAIIRLCFAVRSLPVVGTIPPVNPVLSPASRNIWVSSTNDDLRLMARGEGAAVAEVHGAFLDAPNLEALFFDHVHPNDAGYELIAREFFRAIAGEPQAELAPLASSARETLAPASGSNNLP